MVKLAFGLMAVVFGVFTVHVWGTWAHDVVLVTVPCGVLSVVGVVRA